MKRMTKLLFLAAAAALLLTIDRWDMPIFAAAIGFPSSEHETTSRCQEDGVIALAIRNDGEGWYAINDDDHAPVNVRSVESNSRSITVHFSRPAVSLGAFVVAPDETLALSGFSAGASVAMDSATIVLSRQGFFGVHRVSPSFVTSERYPWSNFWIMGFADFDCG